MKQENNEMMFGDDARKAIRNGVEKLTKAVASTLGPRGRNVVVMRKGIPHITKDGVTVAKAVKVSDKYERIGVEMVKQVAIKTADVVGDGTTTSTVLANAILGEGIKAVLAGFDPMELRNGIDKGVTTALEYLSANAIKITDTKEQFRQVATVSANGDSSIGNIVADAIKKVGADGVVTVENAKSTEDSIDVVTGMQFERGYISPYFVTDSSPTGISYENALVFITDQRILALQPILPVLEAAIQAKKPLLIIAEDVDHEALAGLIINNVRGNMRVCAVKCPSFGSNRKHILQDIAILTGATVVSEEFGIALKDAKPSMLGSAGKIRVGKSSTTIIDGRGKEDDIKARCDAIRSQMEADDGGGFPELQNRLAKLTGGVAIIYAGGSTEIEVMEKRDRIDDALAATRASTVAGILPGGGVALLRASVDVLNNTISNTEGESMGIRIVAKAMREPMRNILLNGGHSPDTVIENVLRNSNHDFGFDCRRGEYVDMVEAGVIDPTKVVSTTLLDAASIASLLITTECIIPEEEKLQPPLEEMHI